MQFKTWDYELSTAFEHSHESGHLAQAEMGGEWVMTLTEPVANAHSSFHKQLILVLSNAISQRGEHETA